MIQEGWAVQEIFWTKAWLYGQANMVIPVHTHDFVTTGYKKMCMLQECVRVWVCVCVGVGVCVCVHLSSGSNSSSSSSSSSHYKL